MGEMNPQNTGGRFWGESTTVTSTDLLEQLNAKARARAAKLQECNLDEDNDFTQNKKRKLDIEINNTTESKHDDHVDVAVDSSETSTFICDNNNDSTGIGSSPKFKKKKSKNDEEIIEAELASDQPLLLTTNEVTSEKQEVLIPKTKSSGDDDTLQQEKKKRKRKKKPKVTEGEKEIGGFTVLAEVEATRAEKVKRVLPHWLKNPELLNHSLSSESILISQVHGLSDVTKKQLQQEKINILFPVQQAVIPALLNSSQRVTSRYQPRDICVSAPTGSGKTLAYVLPIVEILQTRIEPRIRALVLLPVQELAKQVYNVFVTYGIPLGLKIGLAVGQKSFKKEQSSLVQKNYCGYQSLVDVLIATPGRLSDHMASTPGFDLSYLRFLVLDEADKLMAGEHGDNVARIEKNINRGLSIRPEMTGHIPSFSYLNITDDLPLMSEPLQRLLFSATLSHDPEQLQHITLYRPMLFTVASAKKGENNLTVVGQYTRPAELTEQYIVTSSTVKPLLIHYLIQTENWKKTLIFTNSKESTHKLSLLLQSLSKDEYKVSEFSADQGRQRAQIVSQFISGKIEVLVASDAMARGMDIPDIEHVISYDLTSLSTYVHRIGRTARAGKEGKALSLVTEAEVKDFKSLMIGTLSIEELDFKMSNLESYEEVYVEALNYMKNTILEEKKKQKEFLLDSKKGEKRKKIKKTQLIWKQFHIVE